MTRLVRLPCAVLQEFKIQNIVGSCDVKFPIRLEGLCMAHGYFATVSAGCAQPLLSLLAC